MVDRQTSERRPEFKIRIGGGEEIVGGLRDPWLCAEDVAQRLTDNGACEVLSVQLADPDLGGGALEIRQNRGTDRLVEGVRDVAPLVGIHQPGPLECSTRVERGSIMPAG